MHSTSMNKQQQHPEYPQSVPCTYEITMCVCVPVCLCVCG